MSLKRSHKKSRLGCKQCKARRIKCDEVAPCCSSCAKKGLECEYRDWIDVVTPTSFSNTDTSRRPIDASALTPVVRDSALAPAPWFSLEDLGLLHHFPIHSYATLGFIENEEYGQIWRDVVPAIATRQPFLMHAILAFAGAHCVNTTTTEESRENGHTLALARHHYGCSLTVFTGMVDQIDADRADAILCFCVLIFFLTLHLELDTKSLDSEEVDPIDTFAGVLQVLQRSHNLLLPLWPNFKSCQIGILQSHVQNLESHALPEDVSGSLDILEGLITNKSCLTADPSDVAANLDALWKLKALFSLADPKPPIFYLG